MSRPPLREPDKRIDLWIVVGIAVCVCVGVGLFNVFFGGK